MLQSILLVEAKIYGIAMRIMPYILGVVVLVYSCVILPSAHKKKREAIAAESALVLCAAGGYTYIIFKLGSWYGDYFNRSTHQQAGWQDGYGHGYAAGVEASKIPLKIGYARRFICWSIGCGR